MRLLLSQINPNGPSAQAFSQAARWHHAGLLLRHSNNTPSLKSTLSPWRCAPSPRRHLVTLAIETSCDDTCVAVLEKHPLTGAARLHFNKKITSDNRAYGGVHPLTAVLSHTANLAGLVRDAVPHLPSGKPDFVTVTRGPGMISNLSNGLATAKGLAVAWGVPLLGVNHMQAHALTPRLVSALELGQRAWPGAEEGAGAAVSGPDPVDGDVAGLRSQHQPEFPFLSLLVSGGHTMLVLSRSLCSHKILVPDAGNLAMGDVLDKSARDILPPELLAALPDTMYAAALESFAFPDAPPPPPAASAPSSSDPTTLNHARQQLQDYDYEYAPPPRRIDEISPVSIGDGITLTPPLPESRALVYNLTGFGTQVSRATAANPTMPLSTRRALARATMRLAFEHLASRIVWCLTGSGLPSQPDLAAEVASVRRLVVAGGVARNRFLMRVLRATLDARVGPQVEILVPPPDLCTDNAAMIAWTGVEMWEAGWQSDLSVRAVRKWPLDPESEGGGILGESGWLRRGTTSQV